MANGALLVVAAVMGVLLVGAAFGTTRLRKRVAYRPKLEAAGAGLVRRDESSSGVESNTVAFGLAALLVALVAVAVVLGDGALVLLAVAPVLVAGYFSWGVYHMARSRGLPKAHAVGLSAWLFGVLGVGVVALNLLFG